MAALTLSSSTASAAPDGAPPGEATAAVDPAAEVREGGDAGVGGEGGVEIDPQRLFRAGEEAYWLGDFDLAIERFEAAYAASRVPGMLYNVGLAYYRRHDLSRSISDLERARVVLTNYLQADVDGLVAPAHVQGMIDEIDGKIAALRAVPAPQAAGAGPQGAAAPAPACAEAPSTAPAPPDRGARVGGALIGLGAVGLTGGVVSVIAFSLKATEFEDTLVLLDRQRSEAGCRAPATDSVCAAFDASLAITERNGHRANLLTATVGGSLLAVGAGLAIAGGVIYAKARRRQGARERQLSVTPTFGGVVLRGRF